mmetsp:Transcript_14508/g.49113  ORF Transcript_14508/g.49113 Transcript_14508/m.49113 type:complete len:210 (+) Transcript_14508:311-940(+)
MAARTIPSRWVGRGAERASGSVAAAAAAAAVGSGAVPPPAWKAAEATEKKWAITRPRTAMGPGTARRTGSTASRMATATADEAVYRPERTARTRAKAREASRGGAGRPWLQTASRARSSSGRVGDRVSNAAIVRKPCEVEERPPETGLNSEEKTSAAATGAAPNTERTRSAGTRSVPGMARVIWGTTARRARWENTSRGVPKTNPAGAG